MANPASWWAGECTHELVCRDHRVDYFYFAAVVVYIYGIWINCEFVPVVVICVVVLQAVVDEQAAQLRDKQQQQVRFISLICVLSELLLLTVQVCPSFRLMSLDINLSILA